MPLSHLSHARHFARWLVVGVGALCALACGGENSAESTSGVVALELATAPLDARCLQLTIAQGTSTITKKVPVGPNEPASFVATGLPLGSVTLSEQVFTQACSATTTAKWVSDPQMVTLAAGQPLSVTFQLRLATQTDGVVNVRSDFPDPFAGFTRLTANGGSGVIDMKLGPDGFFWYIEGNFFNRGLAKIDPATSEVTWLEDSFSNPIYSLSFGPDGRLWLGGAGEIVRIDPREPAIRQSYATTGSADARSIVAGPDGNMWFALVNANAIGRMTLKGVYTEFPLPTANAYPLSICVGSDGNLWFGEYTGNKIGKITTAGVITEYPVPTANATVQVLTPGPDGNLWFTEHTGNKIGRITKAGAITEYPLPFVDDLPLGIGRGPDGNLWYGRTLGLGRITPTGTITSFNGFGEGINNIITGPDGRLYYTYSEEPFTGIARMNPNQL